MLDAESSAAGDRILSALADREFIVNANYDTVSGSVVRNVPPEEAKAHTLEFIQVLSTLATQSMPENQAEEMLNRAFELASFNIKIRHEFLEFLITIGRSSPGLSHLAFKVAQLIIYTRPGLGVEIVDSEQAVFLLTLMNQPMTRGQMLLVQEFIGSSESVAEIIAEKYNFVDQITRLINNPTSLVHFIQLMDCLTNYVLALSETSRLLVPIFRAVIPGHIFSEDCKVLELTVRLYKVILEVREEEEIVNFMFESDGSRCVDGFLLASIERCQTFAKEQILECFHNVSGASMHPTRLLFERDIEKLAEITPQLNESCQVIVLETACNLMTLGVDEAVAICNLGFLSLASGFLENGSLKSHGPALHVYARLCEYIAKDPRIEAVIQESHVLEHMVSYLEVPKRKLWSLVIRSLCISTNYVRGKYSEDVFSHPLFAGIDRDSLYEMCSTIAAEPKLDRVDKSLYQDVLNLLEYLDGAYDE